MPTTQQIEIPFIYLYDGAALTDGQSYLRLSVPLDEDYDTFRLRRIMGLNSLAESMMLYRASGSYVFSANQRLGNNYALVPEMAWKPSGQIRFDLGPVTRTLIGCGGNPIYTSFLGFQGVKVVRYPVNQIYETPYAYKRLPFTYSYDLTIDWRRYTVAPVLERPRPQYLKIDNFDFELCRMRVYQTGGGPAVSATSDFLVQLYTSSGYALSNAPVPQAWINDAMPSPWNSVFPVPGIVYRVDSSIRFDITSMICNLDPAFPKTYRVEFGGFQRYPVPMGSAE